MSQEQGSESAVSRSHDMKEGEMAEEKEAPRKVSRKDFVKGAAAVAGVGALASCAPAATLAPGETAAPAATCPPAAECAPCPVPGVPEAWDKEADVVVVGFGGAGSAAAIEAARAGASVLLLEKATEEFAGGNTSSTDVGVWCPGNYENAVTYIKALCAGTTPDDLIEAEVRDMMGTYDWMKGLTGGEVFELAESDAEWPGTPGDPEMLSQSVATGPAYAFWKILAQNVEELGIEVLYGTPGKKLVQRPGTKEILGVLAESEGQEIAIKAKKGVVLSCGGFEFNEDMKRSYIGPFGCYGAGSPYNTGDGILMAMEVGADLKNMRNVKGFRPAMNFEGQQGFDYWGRKEVREGGSAIWVNRYGKRFVEESEHERHGHRLNSYWEFFDGAEPYPYEYPNIPLYLIFDQAKMDYKQLGEPEIGWTARLGYSWSKDNHELVDDGYVIKADTLRDLATKINETFEGSQGKMDPAVLEETVTKYNEYCTAGFDPEFGRGSTAGSDPAWLVPIGDGPYYAAELWPGMSCTEGGPKRNTKSQVLDRFDTPIPRLYSAGEMGSMTGFMYQGASNVADALVSGWWAGRNAAAEDPWE